MISMRKPTLDTLGIEGGVLGLFKNGMPFSAEGAVTNVFGPPESRGSLRTIAI